MTNILDARDTITGADTRYGSSQSDEGGLAGYFFPPSDVTVDDGHPVPISALLRGARPVLIDLSGAASVAATAAPWTGRVEIINAESTTTTSMLIRPDGYVAWSGSNPHGLIEAMTTWFGPATA